MPEGLAVLDSSPPARLDELGEALPPLPAVEFEHAARAITKALIRRSHFTHSSARSRVQYVSTVTALPLTRCLRVHTCTPVYTPGVAVSALTLRPVAQRSPS